MSWIEETADAIEKRFEREIKNGETLIIRDEKTLSGRVHVGSLRGIVLHGVVAQLLTESGIKNKFLFELNDFDPMDGLPVNIDQEKYKKYMGQSLYAVPPHIEGFENFPMVFGEELKGVVEKLGIPAEFYRLRPLYLEGKFDEVIREALDHAELIRTIYKEVSGGGKPDDWFPLNVLCENCGNVGTTQVTAWNGEKVTYECKKHMVKWAEGCGHFGEISPFGGTAKLPWKVEWPAKWKVMGVHIEGAGKDHNSAGGSREIGKRICEEVFHYPEPFNIAYEFFNIGGKKMSASKGLGASAKEISDVLPPKLVKLLMIRKQPNQPIDFDPEGKTIPLLFDEYDRLGDQYFKRMEETAKGMARTFQLSQLDTSKELEDVWEMRFTTLSFVVQMPHLDLFEEAAKLKGSALTEEEKKELQERALYVKKWIDELAPEEYKYIIPKSIPIDLALTEEQKSALREVRNVLADPSLAWEGSKIHEAIHAVKEKSGIDPKSLFQPLYKIFLSRTSGPQVGWFLSTFDRAEVLKRLDSILS